MNRASKHGNSVMSTTSIGKVTVIIPVYNTQDYLKRCIESIVNQSYKNIELILIDDCSTDTSLAIIHEYQNRYQNIKVISLDCQKGPGNARSRGLEEATGEYIGFVDSDDWVGLDFYSQLVGSISKNSCDIAIASIFNEEGSPISSSPRYLYTYENVINNLTALNLLSRSFTQDVYITPIVGNKLFRRNFILENNLYFESDSYNEDDIFTFLALLYAKKIVLTPKCGYHYFQRNGSITHAFSKKHVRSLIEAFTVLKEHLCAENIFEQYSSEYFSFLDKCISSTLNMLFSAEKDKSIQIKYIQYLITEFLKDLPPLDYFNHIDIRRIKTFYGL